MAPTGTRISHLIMSLANSAAMEDRLGRKASSELPGNFESPRQEHGDDFVLVGDGSEHSESSQVRT